MLLCWGDNPKSDGARAEKGGKTDVATTAESSSFSRPQTSPRVLGPNPNGPTAQAPVTKSSNRWE